VKCDSGYRWFDEILVELVRYFLQPFGVAEDYGRAEYRELEAASSYEFLGAELGVLVWRARALDAVGAHQEDTPDI